MSEGEIPPPGRVEYLRARYERVAREVARRGRNGTLRTLPRAQLRDPEDSTAALDAVTWHQGDAIARQVLGGSVIEG